MTKAPWKSKNLITRLRWWGFKFCGKGDQENLASDVMCDAADRIEKLEGALSSVTTAWDLWQKKSDSNSFTELFEKICEAKALEGKDGE